jgi:hypothetical protein
VAIESLLCLADLKKKKIQGIEVVGVRSLEEAVKLAFDCPDGEVEEAQEDGAPSLSAGTHRHVDQTLSLCRTPLTPLSALCGRAPQPWRLCRCR